MQQSVENSFAALEITLSPSNDLLNGAAEIATFLFGDIRQRRIVYYLVERKQLPVVRLGCRIYARKSTLLRWLRSREAAIAGPMGLPDTAPTVVVQKASGGREFAVFWKDTDGFLRQRGSFSSCTDAEAYASQLRCRLEIDAYQAELKNTPSH